MKRKRFTEEQIVKSLKRMDAGEEPKALARELGIAQQTLYNWKSKYGGMEISELAELKRLQEENRRLKTMVANLSLDNEALKDLNSRKW